MAVTGFTLATLYRWVTSDEGWRHSLHAFGFGRYPGSGQAHQGLKEMGLDGYTQFAAITRYVEEYTRSGR